MSKIIASCIVALLGTAGYAVSDSTALEVAGLVLNVGGIVAAWAFRAGKPDVKNFLGVKKS